MVGSSRCWFLFLLLQSFKDFCVLASSFLLLVFLLVLRTSANLVSPLLFLQFLFVRSFLLNVLNMCTVYWIG